MIMLLLFYIVSLSLVAFSSKRDIPRIFMVIVASLGVLSFFYTPNEEADLYRHYENIVFYGEMGLEWVLENRTHINPLTSLLLYSFSLFDEPRMFASFSVLVTYGFSFALIYKVSKFYSLSQSKIFFLSAFVLLNWNYLLVVSNCRIFMLYAILAYYFYMEFIEDRCHKSAIVVYLASVLFHYGILLILVPRLFLYLYNQNNKFFYVLLLVMLVLSVTFADSLYQIVLFKSMLEMAEAYEDYKTFGVLQYLNSILCIVVCCLSCIVHRARLSENKEFQYLFWLIILLILFQITNFQVVYRESNVIASLSVVLFAQIIKLGNHNFMRTILSTQCFITFMYYLWFVYSYMEFKFVL